MYTSVASLLSLHFAGAEANYFYTIAVTHNEPLEASLRHIGNFTHGMVVECGATVEPKFDGIRSPTML